MSLGAIGVGLPDTRIRLRPLLTIGVALLGIGLAGVIALLVSMGLWYLALVLLAAAPGFYLIHRYPLVSLLLWVAIDPVLMGGAGGIERRVYWLVHRALPVGAVLVILVARLIGVRKERLPKLGWPEAMMGGYLVLTIISIAYRSADAAATYIYMYDHVLVPLAIYLLVRLMAPKEEDFRRLAPVLLFVLLFQAAVGILEWVAPGLVPSAWNNREYRSSGTLRHPNVYSVVILFAGLYLVHYGRQVRSHLARLTGPLLALALIMPVVTLSRAAWLAAFVVAAGLFFIYRRLTRRVLLILAAGALALAVVGGAIRPLVDTLGSRLYSQASEESALSRLPVIVASLRMIEARPLVGWGYENFDRYDHGFVSSIQGLYVPDKDHASHNFFLTLGAESGLLGLFLYLGPAVWWMVKTPSGLRRLPESGFRSRKLVAVLWLSLASQVVVYNFSNNRVAFGLGLWWLTIGLLATTLDWRESVADEAQSDLERRVDKLRVVEPSTGSLP